MATKVVNVKREAYDLYIGRPGVWGNPFIIGRDGTRGEVLEKHARWIVQQAHLMERLPELKGKRLGCYCAPLACHGDVLARLAELAGTVVRGY